MCTYLFHVCDVYVLADVCGRVQKVPEENHVVAQRIIRVALEIPLYLTSQQLIEPISVSVVYQTILKYSAAFVVPQFNYVVCVLKMRGSFYKNVDDLFNWCGRFLLMNRQNANKSCGNQTFSSYINLYLCWHTNSIAFILFVVSKFGY